MGNKATIQQLYYEAVDKDGKLPKKPLLKEARVPSKSELHPVFLLYGHKLQVKNKAHQRFCYIPTGPLKSRKVTFDDLCDPDPRCSEYHPVKLDFGEGIKQKIVITNSPVPQRLQSRKVFFFDLIDPAPHYSERHIFKLDFGRNIPKPKISNGAYRSVTVPFKSRVVKFDDILNPEPQHCERHPLLLDYKEKLHKEVPLFTPDPPSVPTKCRQVVFIEELGPMKSEYHVYKVMYTHNHPGSVIRIRQGNLMYNDMTYVSPVRQTIKFTTVRYHTNNTHGPTHEPTNEKHVCISILRNRKRKLCKRRYMRSILRACRTDFNITNDSALDDATHQSLVYATQVYSHIHEGKLIEDDTNEKQPAVCDILRHRRREISPLVHIQNRDAFRKLQSMQHTVSLNLLNDAEPYAERYVQPAENVDIEADHQERHVFEENPKKSLSLDIETHWQLKQGIFPQLKQKVLSKCQQQLIEITWPMTGLTKKDVHDYIQHCYKDCKKEHYVMPYLENVSQHFNCTKCLLKFASKKAANKFMSIMHKFEIGGKCDVRVVNDVVSEDIARAQRSSRFQALWLKAQDPLQKHTEKIKQIEKTLNQKTKTNLHNVEAVLGEKKVLKEKMDEMRRQEEEFFSFVTVFREAFEKIAVSNSYKDELEIMEKRFNLELDRFETALPMYAKRDEIVKMVAENQVSILLGETGSGKSTQVTKYLYEAGLANNGMIVCTQPRKVAATTLAKRVAFEMGSKVGGLVGYKVGMQKDLSKSTSILYVTDHVLLKECVGENTFARYSCVIIDEAHERSLNTDLLLGMLKKVLDKRPELRIVITSATIIPDIFVRYFSECPVLKVSGRVFPVDIIYSEVNLDPDSDYLSKASEKAVEIAKSEPSGDILTFLPTPLETEKCCEKTKQMYRGTDIICLALHGKTQAMDQQKVFNKTPAGKRKIVFATNSAETSVTIPGIKYVIDTGLVKEKFFEASKNMSILKVTKVSKSSANQRKGRAGRTESGKCYRLYTRDDYNNMNTSSKPEIMRVHLGMAILQLMTYNIEDVLSFDFVETPPQVALQNAYDDLVLIGAVEDKKLTDLGKKLSSLSLEPRMAKIVIDGITENVGYEAVLIASFSAVDSSVFYRGGSNAQKGQADKLKVRFCNMKGDVHTMLDVYKEWLAVDEKAKNKWCIENSMNAKSLRMVRQTAQEILTTLKTDLRIHLPPKFNANDEQMEDSVSGIILQNFCTNLCIFSGHDRLGYIPLQKANQRLHVHPSSALKPLAMLPKFLIFLNTLITSRNFMINVTCINEDIMAETFTRDVGKVEETVVSPCVIPNIGKSLAIRLIGPKHETRLRLQAELQRHFCTEDLIVDVSVESAAVTAHCYKRYHNKTTHFLTELVETERSRFFWKTIEKPLAESCSIRCVIGHGGTVQHLLFSKEFRSIKFPNMPSYVDEDLIVRNISEMVNVTHHESNTNKNGKKWLKITFVSPSAAVEALNIIHQGLVCDQSAKPDLQAGQTNTPPSNDIELKLSWCRRAAKGFAFVAFDTAAHARQVFEGIRFLHIMGKQCPVQLSKKTQSELFVGRIPTNCSNRVIGEIKQTIQELTGVQPDNVVIPREKETDTSESLCTQVEKIIVYHLENSAIDQSKYKIFVKRPVAHAIEHMAFVTIYNPTDVEDIENALMSKCVMGQELEIKRNLKSMVVVREEIKSYIMDSLEDEIDSIIDNGIASVQWKPKQKGNLVIYISANSFRDLADTRAHICRHINGEKIELVKQDVQYFRMKKGNIYKHLVERKYSVLITLHVYCSCLIIYGNKSNTRKASILLKMKINDLSKLKVKIYQLSSLYPPGMTKTLMAKYGLDLESIPEVTETDSVELSLSKHLLTTRGTQEAIAKVDKLLEDDAKLLETRQSRLCDSEEDCPVCLCEAEDVYRLEYCGHAYCSECIYALFTEAVKNKEFPVVCSKCEKHVVVEDIQQIIGTSFYKLNLFIHASVENHVTSHTAELNYCSTPDCGMVYRTTKEMKMFICEKCATVICSKCHAAFHNGMSCDMYAKISNDLEGKSFDEYSREKWLQDDTKNRALCPKCKSGIEKNGGCMHVACIKCKTHICWHCKASFKSGDETYSHLVKCFGGIFDVENL